MNRLFSLLISAVVAIYATAANANLNFSTANTVKIDGKQTTVYVVESTAGVTAGFTAQASDNITGWFTYGKEGASTARPLAVNRNGNRYSFALPADDCGIMIEYANSQRTFFWIVNYANYPLTISSVSVSPESDCATTYLSVDGVGEPIYYYEYNGIPTEISRDITVSYNSLQFNQENFAYDQVEKISTLRHLQASINIDAPLCDTRFTITGDRFCTKWGQAVTAESDYYNAIAVDCYAKAEQTVRENDNEIRVETNALGGSAPVDINLSAVVTDAARFTEWQFSRDPEFYTIDLRFTEPDLTYTFDDYGVTYVRFVCANNDGSCEQQSETFTVDVSESRLLCPNAFSPNGDGVNDIWKVSYKSITDFQCTIFNRWGVKITEFTNPADGWDGTYKGKTVPSGVYFYVIKATGADDKEYKLAGDINIINYRQGTSGVSDDPVVSGE